MLRWCAYCQQFQGEVPPFADFNMTHGICRTCMAKGAGRLDAEMGHSQFLKQTLSDLMEVGRTGDIHAAEGIIDEASALGIRYVDILIGLVAPLLYIIGQGWEDGTVSIAQEHQFTDFCEKVFNSLNERMRLADPAGKASTGPKLLLLNAYGNTHTLGIRILGLWLRSQNFDAIVIIPSPAPEKLSNLVETLKPQAILISTSLARQRTEIVKMMQSLASAGGIFPSVIIGGYAIKMDLMAPIPGAEFLANVGELPVRLLHALHRK